MKYFFLSIFLIFLASCATTQTTMESKKIKIGMNQVDFCNQFSEFTGAPCSSSFMDGYKNVVKGVYYPQLAMEIMHDEDKKYFFVFSTKNTSPYNYKTRKASYNSKLLKIFTDFEEAKDFAGGKKFSITSKEVDNALEICEKQNLKKGTIELMECVLKRI